MENEKELMSVTQVLERSREIEKPGVVKNTLLYWASTGKLACVRLGANRARFFLRADVERFLTERQCKRRERKRGRR